MNERIQVIIESDDKEIPKGEPIFNFADGEQCIHTYDKPQWLTQEQIDQLENNGFTVTEV